MSAFTLAELIELRDKTKAAYMKAVDSHRYKIGQGGTARENERDPARDLMAALNEWERQVKAHPDYVAPRAVRRVRYLRPY